MSFQKELQNAIQTKWSSNETTETLLNNFFYPPNSEFATQNAIHLKAFSKQSSRTHSHLQFSSLTGYCMIYTTEGECNLYYDDTEYTLVSESIAFLDCSKGFTLYRPEIRQWASYILFIDGANTNYFFELYYKDQVASFLLPPASSFPEKINTIFSCTLSVWNGEYSELIISKLLTDIMVASSIEKSSNPVTRQALPNHIVNALAYINQHYREPISLDSIAEGLNISKYTLSHDFREHIGVSVMENIIQKRINDAKELLSTTEASVIDISTDVGFSNNTHFIQTFKKRVGVTPLQYRKQHNIHSYAHILNH